jgi:hypothetical protein
LFLLPLVLFGIIITTEGRSSVIDAIENCIMSFFSVQDILEFFLATQILFALPFFFVFFLLLLLLLAATGGIICLA